MGEVYQRSPVVRRSFDNLQQKFKMALITRRKKSSLVNEHREITIFALFLTACNSGTAQWKNFIPVKRCRAAQEL